MVLSVIKYGALSGKTRAMFGRLLKSKDYHEMVQKRSVSDIASYLKYNTHYNGVLENEEESRIHRGHLENTLKHAYITDFSKLMKFSFGDIRDFIGLVYKKLEIESLKLLFRVFEAGHFDQEKLDESLLFLTRKTELNIPKLALSRNLEELIAGLKGSSYYEVLRPFMITAPESRLFSLEMALDLYYFKMLQDATQRLHGKDQEIARQVYGTEIDAFNIFWIYRAKQLYRKDKEWIYSYIVSSYYKISRKDIDRMVSANSTEEFLSAVKDTPYNDLFHGYEPGEYEYHYWELMYRMHRKNFRRDNFSIACVISFLRLKEIELNNIISIIEGIRYKLSPEQIQRFVVGFDY
jgi:V/A-type H+-transporting ATPase subunit C